MTDDKRINPQVERTHDLMLDAAATLLAKGGPAAVTHLRVAEEAGVARATVYRHWSNQAEILLDLLLRGVSVNIDLPALDLPVDERLIVGMKAAAAALSGPTGQALSAMVGLAEWDDDVAAALEQATDFGPRLMREMLAAAVEQGELAIGTDAGLLADRLIGPLFLRRLLYHDELTDAYVEQLVSVTLASHRPA